MHRDNENEIDSQNCTLETNGEKQINVVMERSVYVYIHRSTHVIKYSYHTEPRRPQACQTPTAGFRGSGWFGIVPDEHADEFCWTWYMYQRSRLMLGNFLCIGTHRGP